MQYRQFGKTGYKVSSIALGTVSLGIDYGIQTPGGFGRPIETDAVKILQEAANAGVNLFDTAPAYGESERLLGQALGSRCDCYFATKVPIPRDDKGNPIEGRALRQAIRNSLEDSRFALQRDVLDVVQIHNATLDVITNSEITEVLLDSQRQGKIRFLGVSVYTEVEAMKAIKTGYFDILQVAYNLLDQRMARRVFSEAERTGTAIITRSVFLKGALTTKAQWLPPELSDLKRAVERSRNILACSWQSLPEVALRFCLATPQVATVLVGVRTVEELYQALTAEKSRPLSEERLLQAASLALEDEYLLNPSYWSIA